MKHCVIVLLVLLCGFSFAQEIKKSTKTETIEGKKFYLHTVEKGQTIYTIAKTYDVSKNDIIIENPELIDGLKDNSVIRIPYKKALPVTPTKINEDSQLHKVEQGQTLYSISKKYNVTTDDIIKLNPEINSGLKAGQTIKIPVTEKSKTTVYVEEKNENAKSTVPSVISDEKKVAVKDEVSVVKTVPEPIKIENVSGDLINVAVLLPFYTNLNTYSDSADDKNELYIKSQLAIEFYQGLQLAADSLTREGVNIRLFVYDTENDSVRVEDIMRKSEMLQMNLIIGPLYAEELSVATAHARKNNIPLISPFSQTNKILLGKPNVFKAVASNNTQTDVIAKYICEKYSGQNFILLHSDIPKEKNLVDTFKKKFNNYRKSKFDSLIILNTKQAGIAEIEKKKSATKLNILYAPVSDQSLTTELFNKLYALKDSSFVVFGHENWINFENIEVDRFFDYQVHIPSAYYVNYDDNATKRVVDLCRNKFSNDVNKYSFQGFDVTYYFIKLFASQRENFMKSIGNYPFTGVQTQFNFYQTAVESGWENQSIHLLKYENYQLKKVN